MTNKNTRYTNGAENLRKLRARRRNDKYMTNGTWTGKTGKRPTCFSEKQLDSYVWNNTGQKKRKKIEAHLKTCQTCYTQVMEMTAFKTFVTKRFGNSQGPHPTPEEIEDFCYARTQTQNETTMLSHIASCDECHELLQGLRREKKLVSEGIISYLDTPTELPARLLKHYKTHSKRTKT